MADSPAPASPPPPATPSIKPEDIRPPENFPLTLNEFCMQASSQGVGVEMLAGFHHDEIAGGHLKDLATVFQVRLDAFATRPA
jgi:hypothetical protein